MVTLFITSVLILGLVAIAIYFWQKPANTQTIDLPPATMPRALFSDIQPIVETAAPEPLNREDRLSRAHDGDLSVLDEAGENSDYDEILSILVIDASSEPKLLRLASYISQRNLPVNQALVEAMIQSWQVSPDRNTTAKMLHFAALSDDAETYQKAVELAFSLWRTGKLPDVSARELQALFTGEFWVLSSGVRSTGNGFVLKRTLSSARRELEGTTDS
jgi:hypothetical protein